MKFTFKGWLIENLITRHFFTHDSIENQQLLLLWVNTHIHNYSSFSLCSFFLSEALIISWQINTMNRYIKFQICCCETYETNTICWNSSTIVFFFFPELNSPISIVKWCCSKVFWADTNAEIAFWSWFAAPFLPNLGIVNFMIAILLLKCLHFSTGVLNWHSSQQIFPLIYLLMPLRLTHMLEYVINLGFRYLSLIVNKVTVFSSFRKVSCCYWRALQLRVSFTELDYYSHSTWYLSNSSVYI